jgi:hypothetical protein
LSQVKAFIVRKDNPGLTPTKVNNTFSPRAAAAAAAVQVNAFLVRKGTPGFTPTKIENKIALRCVQNADMLFERCFVPDSARLPGMQGVCVSRGMQGVCISREGPTRRDTIITLARSAHNVQALALRVHLWGGC